MTQYLSEPEFLELQTRLAQNEASLTIGRRIARQVFTRVSNSEITSTFGRSQLWKKAIIWTTVIGPILLFVLCLGALIPPFGWMAAIAVPLVGIFWTVLIGYMSDKGTLPYNTAGLAVALLLVAFVPQEYGWPVALLAVSVWINHLGYVLAQHWVEAMARDSFKVYDMLVEHIAIKDADHGGN